MSEVPLYRAGPHGGVRGFRPPSNTGCYVTTVAPHKARKLIARGTLTFDEKVVPHRVAGDISMIKWIRTSRLSIKNSLYGRGDIRAHECSLPPGGLPLSPSLSLSPTTLCPVQTFGRSHSNLDAPPDVTFLLRSTLGAIDLFPGGQEKFARTNAAFLLGAYLESSRS